MLLGDGRNRRTDSGGTPGNSLNLMEVRNGAPSLKRDGVFLFSLLSNAVK